MWRRFAASREGGLRASLFDRYRRYARHLANRHARRQRLDRDRQLDLEQFAYRGLLEAIDRFDPANGSSFTGFATARIRGSMLDGMAQLDEYSARQRFQRRLERERLASLGGARADGRSALDALADMVAELALGLMLDAEERRDPGGLIGSPDSGFDCLAWRETSVLLQRRVAELPEPEQTVIRQHYQNDLLFSQIATMLGLSKGRISQLHSSALEKLRKSMRPIR